MESQHKDYNFECASTSCSYENISPFEYTITFSSPDYKNIILNWKPTNNAAIKEINFQKDYTLESVNLLSQEDATEILNEAIQSEEWETIQEKIQKLKDQQNIHLRIEIGKNIYTFRTNDNDRELSLYQDDKKLGNFQLVEKSEISLQEIIANDNYLSIDLWTDKYLFSKLTWKIHKYTLEIPISYIKATHKNWEFIFVTQKGSFVYNIYEDTFQYNSYFSDFVFFNKNSLVGIINSDDTNKLQRFENTNNQNLIVLFNPSTKQQEILLETDKKIKKIFKKDGIIYFEDENAETFALSHLIE